MATAPALCCLALVAFTACSPSGEEAPTAQAEREVTVELTRARSLDWMENAHAVGVLHADETVTLRNTVPGHVERIQGSEGSTVEQGEVVVKLEDEILRLDFERAASLQRQRQRDYERTQRLFADGNVSESEYLAAKTQMETAQSDLARAGRRLRDTEIRAPITGVLGRRHISLGDYAENMTPLFDLFKVDRLRLDFNLPKRYLGSVRAGQRVELKTRGLTGKTFHGKVYFVDPALDPATRTVRVRAYVDNPEGLLSPNLFVNLSLEVGVIEDSVVIPEEALITDLAGYSVFVVDDAGYARRRNIEIGQRAAGEIRVVDGLVAGEAVVETGHQRLFDGVRIRDRRARD